MKSLTFVFAIVNGEIFKLSKISTCFFFSLGKLKIVRPFTSSPNDIIQNKKKDIKCVFDGWPLPHTVYWLKNSKLITNGTEGIYHVLQRKGHLLYSRLHLPPGREDQEGVYKCHATNSIPGWTSSISRSIEMHYKCKLCQLSQ